MRFKRLEFISYFKIHVYQYPNLITDLALDRHSNTNVNHITFFFFLTTLQENISGYMLILSKVSIIYLKGFIAMRYHTH